MSSSEMDGTRELILSLKSPAVFHGMTSDWDILKWGETEWCNLFGEVPVPFRCGLKTCTRKPQWERTCATQYITMNQFFRNAKNADANSWQYFDYKYLKDWLKESNAFKTVSWAQFGFPEVTSDECTLWIGSSGAHTPCHFDSYGCNLVAQIYGHKQWILFAPSESAKLKMTRVPYEESSVYSALNFNAPSEDINESLDEIYIVTLSPGDVLFVPNHWWHYVENLDTAIAVNTWLPLPEDDNYRLDESLVRFFISQSMTGVSLPQWLELVNPNEDTLKTEELSSSLSLIKVCLEKVAKAANMSDSEGNKCVQKPIKHQKTVNFETIINNSNEHAYVSAPPKKLCVSHQDLNCSVSSSVAKSGVVDFKLLTKSKTSELKNILDAKCKCGSKEEHTVKMNIVHDTNNTSDMLQAVINAFCHPDVLKTVKSVLQQQTSERL